MQFAGAVRQRAHPQLKSHTSDDDLETVTRHNLERLTAIH